MKKGFEQPGCEVVRFSCNNIVTSNQCDGNCWCYSLGTDYGYGVDGCVGANKPECTCALVTEANCV